MAVKNYIGNITVTQDDFVIIPLKPETIISDRSSELIKSYAREVFISIRDFDGQSERSDVLIFDVKGFEPLNEFLKTKVLNYSQIKKLFQQLGSVVLDLKNAQISPAALLFDVDYIFVDKITFDLKFIYLPIETMIDPYEADISIQELIKYILFNILTDKFYDLQGWILGYVNTSEEFSLNRFVEKLSNQHLDEDEADNKSGFKEKLNSFIPKVLIPSVLVPAIFLFISKNNGKLLIYNLGIGLSIFFISCIFEIVSLNKHLKTKKLTEFDNELNSFQSTEVNLPIQEMSGNEKNDEKGSDAKESLRELEESPEHVVREYCPVENEAQDISEGTNKSVKVSQPENLDLEKSDTETLFDGYATSVYLKKINSKKEETVFLEEKPITVGNAKTADLKLNSKTVSPEHARLEFVDGSYYVTDLNSKIGTFVNEVKIKPNQKFKLCADDIIIFGNVSYKFVISKSL